MAQHEGMHAQVITRRSRLNVGHTWSGIALVVIFAATGAYMRFVLQSAEIEDELTRMILRADHIYLLLMGIVHFMVGNVNWPLDRPIERGVRILGSVLLYLGPVLVLSGFFAEYDVGLELRTLSAFGIFAFFGGSVAYFVLWLLGKLSQRTS